MNCHSFSDEQIAQFVEHLEDRLFRSC